MSRFLKFIVHLVVICAIICVLGLTVPPFFGVTTVIVDDVAVQTNLPMGSVTYAIPKKTADIYVGEPILVREDSSTYRYEVQTINLNNGTGTVIDPTVTDGQPITVAVRDYVPKVVITIGYVGYLMTATKSIEGLIILGLCVVFLIILYVIAELWKKDGKKSSDTSIPEIIYDTEPMSARELEQEESRNARVRRAEEKAEARALKKKKKEEKRIHTGGFVDDIDEEDEEDYDDEPVTMQPAEREAHALLRKEIAAATADETLDDVEDDYDYEDEEEEYTGLNDEEAEEEELELDEDLMEELDDGSDVPEAVSLEPAPEPAKAAPKPAKAAPKPEKAAPKTEKAAPKTEAASPVEDEAEAPEIAELRRRAMPGYSASQLADEAKAGGYRPDMVRDDITDVTLFDYSDILDDLLSSDTDLKS